jgi:hypothetical protein
VASIIALSPEFAQPNGARSIGVLRIRSCATVASLEHEIVRDPAVAIIYEPGFGLANRPELVHAIELLGIRLIIRFPLLPPAITEFVTLARLHPWIAASIRPHDSVELLAATLGELDGGPVASALSHIESVAPEPVLPYLAGALVLGRRRVRGLEHAAAFLIQPRTLESQHHKLGIPEPRRMRAWGGAVWALWRLDHWGWSLKRTAASAGFANGAALSEAFGPVLRGAPDKRSATDRVAWAVDQLRNELLRRAPAASIRSLRPSPKLNAIVPAPAAAP